MIRLPKKKPGYFSVKCGIQPNIIIQKSIRVCNERTYYLSLALVFLSALHGPADTEGHRDSCHCCGNDADQHTDGDTATAAGCISLLNGCLIGCFIGSSGCFVFSGRTCYVSCICAVFTRISGVIEACNTGSICSIFSGDPSLIETAHVGARPIETSESGTVIASDSG